MKQIAIALVLSVLLYCHSLIMRTTDHRLPWALKIMMIALVTVALLLYRSRLAIRYFDDRMLLTDTHTWVYYQVPSISCEFTAPEEREALATNITVALAAIRMHEAEVHLRTARWPYPSRGGVGDRPGGHRRRL